MIYFQPMNRQIAIKFNNYIDEEIIRYARFDNNFTNEKIVLDIILKDPNITIVEMANQSNKSIRTINRIINSLKEKNLIKRMNSNKDGYWEVLK